MNSQAELVGRVLEERLRDGEFDPVVQAHDRDDLIGKTNFVNNVLVPFLALVFRSMKHIDDNVGSSRTPSAQKARPR